MISKKQNSTNQLTKDEINYVAIGDSYTIGEGISANESWPVKLEKRLQEENIPIKLVANPSVTGYTTQDVIDRELSVYDSADPEFATLLIGVNDWVQGVEKETFRANLMTILDRMQSKLPDKKKLVLVTIPDFTKTPTGKNYDRNGDGEKGIAEFNQVIKDEAKKRNLPVVDIYPISQEAKEDPGLVAFDGLHPSGKQYESWVDLIYPVALSMLQKQ